jgi:hypothetical protein
MFVCHAPNLVGWNARLESTRSFSRDISAIDRQTGASDEAGFGGGEIGH